jgi:hypothetical protein
MSKLTPEQAWSHVKALWPNATCMEKFAMINNFSITSIDWPEGVDRYPPKEEWRDAVWPDDWNKPCRYKRIKADNWQDGYIVGNDDSKIPWIITPGRSQLHWSEYCQVRVTEDKKLNPLDYKMDVCHPMETAPKDRYVELLMGGRWWKGFWSDSFDCWLKFEYQPVDSTQECIDWDREHQPTAWREIKESK